VTADSIQFTRTYQYVQNPLQSTVLNAGSVLGMPANAFSRLLAAVGSLWCRFSETLGVTGLLVKGLIMLTYSHILMLTCTKYNFMC